MNIRHADMSDLTAVAAVETACFPPAEAATEQDFAQRLRYYSGHFWLMFDGGTLKGFASVESRPMGTRGQYRDLSSLHVSAECRRRGLGRVLFAKAAGWARAQGAEKLYISSHSALETQRFYRALGCTDALEPDAAHTAREPFDCQLEYRL